MSQTSGAVSAIQAALIEDLGDPNGPTMGGGVAGHGLPPRVRVGTELLGISFMRSWHGDPDQRAWETCTDPLRMMRALAMVGEEAPIRVITKGVERFIDQTIKMLEGADPWDAPHADERLAYLQQVLGTSKSIKQVATVAIQCRRAVDDTPAAALAHAIYLTLPTAPARFSEEHLDDEELICRLSAITARLNPAERKWLGEMLQGSAPLTTSQRERANQVLRSRGPWAVFSTVW